MKAIMKNVTLTENNADLIEFAQTIDFTELFEHIKSFAGVNCSFYQPEITTNCGSLYINFMSDDIAAQAGPFGAILRTCYFRSINNGVVRDKEIEKPRYWVSVNIAYDHKDGGSNGMEITRGYYENDTWLFRDVGEKN